MSTRSPSPGPGPDTITVSLSGTYFETTLETLVRAPFFGALLSRGSGENFRLPDDGVFRIDKAPRPFALILEYLREGLADMAWGDSEWTDGGLLAAVGRDASYYGCDELADFVAKVIAMRLTEGIGGGGGGGGDGDWSNAAGQNAAHKRVVLWMEATRGLPGSAVFLVPSPSRPLGGPFSFTSKMQQLVFDRYRDCQKFTEVAIWDRISFIGRSRSPESTLDWIYVEEDDTFIARLISAGAPLRVDSACDAVAAGQILMGAIINRLPKTVSALIERGVDVNRRYVISSPLHLAIMNMGIVAAAEHVAEPETGVVLALINGGAVIRIGSHLDDYTSSDHFVVKHVLSLSAYARRGEILSLLARKGVVDIDARGTEGSNALHRASSTSGMTEEIALLLAAGANADEKDSNGRTPLSHAIFLGSVDAVTHLLNAGADTGIRDNLGNVAGFYLRGGQRTSSFNPLPALVSLLMARGVPLD